jgi:type VI secretion system protein VasG
MDINLKTLIGKLNDASRLAATRAANLCVGLGQYEVDIEHLFLALLEQPDCDLVVVARQAGISLTGLETDLRKEVERLPGGSTRTPVFSRHLPLLFEHAWLIASLNTGTPGGQPQRIRSGHLLLALLTEPGLAQLAQRASRRFAEFPLERLKHDFDKLTRGSQEAAALAPAQAQVQDGGADPVTELQASAPGKTPALDQFTTCLTARAREGKVDPVIGRDAEIRQVIDILMRRRQNNPILTGEAGVGKTAVVEGLALRIAQGDVPDVLRGVEIHTLDMGLLQAGASVKGEFENRLKNVIDEVKKSLHPIILFIDEAHTMIGAGGTAGQNDAANLLKPALARGELRTIAATTWGEYKKYFEKDAALARRFQVVKVEEPDEETACAMLRAMAPLMESHFGVRIFDEAIREAVRLSHRYISGRQLPDKAISVLDTACAKVALGQKATPAALEEAVRGLERLDARIAALVREESGGADHAAMLAALRGEREELLQRQAALREQWDREQALSAEIHAMRTRLEAGDDVGKNAGQGVQALVDQLRALQGETPLVPLQVDGHTVAGIVASWTGIPLGRMVKDEIRTVMNLQGMLDERILGQRHASAIVAQRVRTARANLEDPNKPKGVFLFVGSSGVGKTETALALADLLYGGERKLVTINMSEYQEAHSVSGLKGSPPGYVGYGEGGVLTEAVRRNPYSVVLLDEVEKAHSDVLELFFQVFDKGVLDDAEGRQIDFRNTIIILTSNAASSQIMQACLNKPVAERPAPEQLAEMIRPGLMKHFKPAFLGRLAVVPFYPIDDEVLANIIRLKLERIKARVAANHGAQFLYDDALVAAVLARCTEVDSGARNVDTILNGTLLPEIADNVLAAMAAGGGIRAIKVGATKGGKIKYAVEPA